MVNSTMRTQVTYIQIWGTFPPGPNGDENEENDKCTENQEYRAARAHRYSHIKSHQTEEAKRYQNPTQHMTVHLGEINAQINAVFLGLAF